MTAAVEKPDEMTFEETIERIREIVSDLEGGQLSLEDSIEKYREGSKLIEHTRQLIADAELRISELSASAAEG
ncbi:MAG TPA: exodeoxyribonuclease VII small subunit [Thermomicrobiales bacterium]|jgi:exodeoxyribonuclease VII small subunit|nr:exodeoxyribonuclease VII small subunit [Thermomicrobiales bacterium]